MVRHKVTPQTQEGLKVPELGAERREQEIFSHYRMVESLGKLLTHKGSTAVAQRLDAVAEADPRRAAIALADLYADRKPLENHRACYEETLAYNKQMTQTTASMVRVIVRLQRRDDVLEALEALPTLDAYRFRTDVLKHKLIEAVILTSAAVLRVAGGTDLPEIVCMNWLQEAERGALRERISSIISQRFESLANEPVLGLRNQVVLQQFHELVQRSGLFSIEKYGYAEVSNTLQRAKDVGGVAQVHVPWGESFDLPHPDCHQCNDSALTARSYFSGMGIPSDVWIVNIGSTLHNVTVVYFSEGDKFVPVVVDASPYGGMYSVRTPQGMEHIDFCNPVGIQEIRATRAMTMPIMCGDHFYGTKLNGLIPWFSQDLPNEEGHIVAMAGVQANQTSGGFLVRSYSAQAQGRGERDPKVVMSLLLFPGKDSKFARESGKPCGSVLVTEKKNGKLKTLEVDQDLSKKQVARMLEVASKRFPSIKETVERLHIDLSKRVFNVDDDT
jgi:hypothetical protein